MREGYSLSEWNYAFPTRPSGSSSVHIRGGSMEGRICSTSIEMIFHECSDYGLKSLRESMLGMCAILQLRYTILGNKYHMHRK